MSVGPLLKQLQLQSISDVIKEESANMVHRVLKTETPIYPAEQFTRVSERGVAGGKKEQPPPPNDEKLVFGKQ